MTTIHAQTGIKLATKPAKTSLLGGHFIYRANGTTETPSSANVVEWVDNDPTLWRHNVHIGSSGIKLRYGETTLSKWDTNSLIFYKPRIENGSIVTDKGIEITSSGIDVFGGSSNANKKVASFGRTVVLGQNENNNVRTEISDIDFSIIEKDYQGQDTKIFSLDVGDYRGYLSLLNPSLTFGDRNIVPPSVAYDDTSTYWVGKTCIYDNEEYVCKEQIDTPEAFDSSKWKKVVGYYSSAFGAYNVAAGTYSFAEGYDVTTIGDYSHAEGNGSIACGNYSHAEGYTQAIGDYSHAEGNRSIAYGNYSHVEGYGTRANGNYSHAEGKSASAGGDYSHAEGYDTSASGTASHAEGYGTSAYGNYSHAMGRGTIAGDYQTAMGQYNAIDSSASFIIGNGSSDSNRSNLFTITNAGDLKIKSNNIWIINGTDSKNYLKIGSDVLEFFMNINNVSTSVASFGETARIGQIANDKSRVEIKDTGIDFYNRTSNTDVVLAHIGYGQGTQEGGSTSKEDYPYYTFGLRNSDSPSTRGNYSFAAGTNNYASGWCSHAEGATTHASGECSHTEGSGTSAEGIYSHAEGQVTKAKDAFCHAEGYYTEASNYSSHAEGYHTKAIGFYSHAEGYYTEANGYYSHAEGYGDSSGSRKTTAHGVASHAEGYNTIANSPYTHAQNLGTIAGYPSQTVIGKYNKNQTNTAFEIGNGSDYAESNRSNAFAVDWDGVARLAGSLFTGCSSSSTLGYEFGRKTGNHVVIGGIHVCWGLETITHTSSGYKEVQVTLPYTYTSAPKCFASYGNRSTSGAPRTASATQGSLAGNKIYVGSYATGSVDAYVNWMTIGV